MNHNLSPADIADRANRKADYAHRDLADFFLTVRQHQAEKNLLDCPAISNLYYSGAISVKSWDKKVAAALKSPHAAFLAGYPRYHELIAAVRAAFVAAEEARANRKAALEASRAVRAEKAKEIKRVGVKLPKQATEETFRTLHAGVQGLLPNLTELYFHHILAIKTKFAEGFAKQFNKPVELPDKARVRAEAKREAADALAAFAAKLTEKIDTTKRVLQSVIRVELTAAGDPRGDSKIVVGFDIGADQVWITQTIVNRSKYDKLFNQFPTRRAS